MPSPLPRHQVHGLAWRLLFAGLLLALVQQYGLQRRPGRLLAMRPAVDAAAVLELRYSRPVDPASLAASIQLAPDVPLSATANGATVQLRLSQPYRASGPLEVSLGGQDQQGRPLSQVRLRWDPRPLLLGLVSGPQGQRLELAWPDAGGAWQPVTPWESRISNVLPLRDGRGVVYAAAVDPLSQKNWFVAVEPSSVALRDSPTASQPAAPPQPLPGPATLYSHFSSSNRGQLLLQGVNSAALEQPADHPPFLQLLQPNQARGPRWLGRRDQPWRQTAPLDHRPAGPAALLPSGDGLVLPDENGLVVVSLPPLSPQRHLLPGNRDLKTFCGAGQRAVVLEHQPDYVKTIELLRPGLAPEVVWEGEAAILAVACDETAERIWLLTVDGVLRDGQPRQDILLLEVQPGHGVVAALHLSDHSLSPTPTLHYDPVTHRLLTVLEHATETRSEALLITLTVPGRQVPPQLTSINKPMNMAYWLVRS